MFIIHYANKGENMEDKIKMVMIQLDQLEVKGRNCMHLASAYLLLDQMLQEQNTKNPQREISEKQSDK